jgi:hypothetical protein
MKNTWSSVPLVDWDFAAAVTPSDTAHLQDSNGNNIATVGLYVGTAGFLVVDLASGATGVIFPYITPGFYKMEVIRVRTSSTCGNILALW